MNKCRQQIETIFHSGKVLDASGKECDLGANIDAKEGEFIFNVIKDNGCRKTLEVGCAMGMSSLYICSALEGVESASHTIIDPMQSSDWNSLGITQLERAGVDFYQLLEEPSEYALPLLVQKGEKFDFCFIDGWHTFDHTLIDFFYIDRLLDVGGIVVIDDISFSGIKKLMRYLLNYPNYQMLGNVPVECKRGFMGKVYDSIIACFRPLAKIFPMKMRYKIFSDNVIRPDRKLGLDCSMLALRKTALDSRRWDWYVDF